MRYLPIIAALLISTTASAFTDAEKAELVKFHEGRLAIANALHRASVLLVNGRSDTDRTRTYDILRHLHSALRYTKGAHERLLHEPGTATSRVDEVAEGFNFLANAIAVMNAAKEAAEPWQDDEQLAISMVYLDEATAWFNSMDRSLGYLDWRVSAFPRVIGPHGDYENSLNALNGSGHYLQRSLGDAVRFYGTVEVWPTEANEGFQTAIASWAQAHRDHIRTRGLDAEIILDDDRAVIEADTAASSGLRPFGFFRALLTFEYIFGHAGEDVLTFTGRKVKSGVRSSLIDIQAGMTLAMNQVMRVNTNAEMAHHMEDGTQTLGTFYLDFSDFWSRMDTLGVAWMVFFHEIPAPPPGGPGPCPTCPPVVTCGTGTVLQGSECVRRPFWWWRR